MYIDLESIINSSSKKLKASVKVRFGDLETKWMDVDKQILKKLADSIDQRPEKLFQCNWDETTFFNENFESGSIQELQFFRDTHGYSSKDIQAIDNLKVGDVWESEDYDSAHTVKRVK